MKNKYKNHSIKEIWAMTPKRFQVFGFMLLISIQVELFVELQNLFPKDSWSHFNISILLIIYIVLIMYYSRDWIMNNEV